VAHDKLPKDVAPTLNQLPKGSRRAAQFTVLTGDDAGAVFVVVDALVLGRVCDLSKCFEIGGVSREHARVWRSANGAFHLEDLDSANGTFVNDIAVERRTLIVGDKIRLGPTLELKFDLTAPGTYESAD